MQIKHELLIEVVFPCVKSVINIQKGHYYKVVFEFFVVSVENDVSWLDLLKLPLCILLLLQGSVADPIVSKYIASGLSREAVPLAVANYGDNPTKVLS